MSNAIKAHMLTLKTFAKTFDTLTEDFNDIVLNSVKLLWGEGNGQIAVINNTMNTLQHLKGADMRALSTYYKECVPYMFDNELGRFTTKNDERAKKMESTYMQFLLENNWYEFSKVSKAKPYTLNMDAIIKLVDNRLTKGTENGVDITEGMLEQLAVGINDVLDKHTKDEQVAETTPENVDLAIAEELKAVNS